MANHMAEVAKMLGVELGERFQVINIDTNKPVSEYDYYFTDKDIEIDAAGHGCSREYILLHLVYGNYIIKRKPWKPQDYEKYWCVEPDGSIDYGEMSSTAWDLNFYKLGNCYRTREEAEANRDKWVQFYASDEVLEV